MPAVAPKAYSLTVAASEREGHGPIHTSILKSKLTLEADSSVFGNFQIGLKKNPNGNCLGWRPVLKDGQFGPYKWLSYKQAFQRAVNFGAGLEHLQFVPTNNDNLKLMAIYMKNCPEWVLSCQGLYSVAGTVVPLYDSLGETSTEFILSQTKLATVVCTLPGLEKLVNVQVETLKNVVLVGPGDKDLEAKAKEKGLNVVTIEHVEEVGKKNPLTQKFSLTKEDMAILMYTSGTTGDPKGAMLTHEAQLVCADAFRTHVGDSLPSNLNFFNSEMIHMSYLPLAHIFENFVHITVYKEGGGVAFYQGNPLKLVDDLKELRPTFFISVPRLLNKIFDKISNGVETGSGLKRFLFNTGLANKKSNLEKGHCTHAFWDALIFSGLRKKLGLDRCAFIATGSAPISDDVMNFLQAAFACPVIEGYGQTETCGGTSCTHACDFTSGSVGGPLPCSEIKLVSVSEMGYEVTDTKHEDMDCDGRGEICVRGKHLFSGYYQNEEETKKTIDEDGWVHSGDIGLWTVDGKIKIIDRKKNIFKLSQGEYVAPEKIENILASCHYVSQIYVYGDSYHSLVVAIVVPDEAMLISLAEKLHVTFDKWQDLCNNEKIQEALHKDLKAIAKDHKLAGYETPKQIFLHPEQFTVENDLLTPTFKLKRPIAKELFQSEIQLMYEKSGDNIAGKNLVQGK